MSHEVITEWFASFDGIVILRSTLGTGQLAFQAATDGAVSLQSLEPSWTSPVESVYQFAVPTAGRLVWRPASLSLRIPAEASVSIDMVPRK